MSNQISAKKAGNELKPIGMVIRKCNEHVQVVIE